MLYTCATIVCKLSLADCLEAGWSFPGWPTGRWQLDVGSLEEQQPVQQRSSLRQQA